MRLLLDAHALLWTTELSPNLSDDAREAISDVNNAACVSIATLWEIAIKVNIGKLNVHAGFFDELESKGFELLPITVNHIRHFQSLPIHHRDPFDRILVAQAQSDGLTLVTCDSKLFQYDVPILKA